MSDIPRARELLSVVLASSGLPAGSAAAIRKALVLMTRQTPVGRSRAKPIVVDQTVRERVRKLYRAGKSQAQIAQIVGLRNGGRVSEILNGKR